LKPTHYIKEFGVITTGSSDNPFSSGKLEIDAASFKSLANFIEENQNQDDFDKAFSIYQKKGTRFIKVKNYVGVIETKEGVIIEILPKTFIGKSGEEANKEDSKKLLLTMLRTLKNSPFINLNIAHLKEQKNFPILEVFISAYLTELSNLLSKELRGDYITIEDNTRFLKGKLLLKDHIKKNSYNKSNFFCQFDEFNTNIPPNKLIKSTLLKLNKISSLNINKKIITKSLQYFELVEKSINIDSDISYCNSRYRGFNNYGNLINWSEIFLRNKSFTNFHGKSINQAILFPMEKLFESYIGHLIKKFCAGFSIKTQDKRYYLVSQKNNHGDTDYSKQKFQLKPDFVINRDVPEMEFIIDTKWKILNSDSKKYDIKEADIYQMHAYGKRYQNARVDKSAPRLALIYPLNPSFQEQLPQFTYGNDLLLDVIPFDFSRKNHGEQIIEIMDHLVRNIPMRKSAKVLYLENNQNEQLNAAEAQESYEKPRPD
jgi:5-methylcytosine-specific restriction enzyme subunit McrC